METTEPTQILNIKELYEAIPSKHLEKAPDYYVIMLDDELRSLSTVVEELIKDNILNNNPVISEIRNDVYGQGLKDIVQKDFLSSLDIDSSLIRVPSIILLHENKSTELYYFGFDENNTNIYKTFFSLLLSENIKSHSKKAHNSNLLMPIDIGKKTFEFFIDTFIDKCNEELNNKFILLEKSIEDINDIDIDESGGTYYANSQLYDQFELLTHLIEKVSNLQDLALSQNRKIDDLHVFNKLEFKKIHSDLGIIKHELNNIEKNIQSAREEFEPKMLKLAKDEHNEFSYQELEEYRNKLDQILLSNQNRLIESVPNSHQDLGELMSKVNNFEPLSLKMIRSSLIAESLVGKLGPDDNFDYSACAVGYWKALEHELNIIIADAIRMERNFIDKFPSKNLLHKSGKCVVKGIDSNQKTSNVNLNASYNSSELKSIMFGPLIKIANYHTRNELKSVLEKVNSHSCLTSNIFSYFKELTHDINFLVVNYRNKGSHTQMLDQNEFSKLKLLVLKSNGIYQKTNELKNSMNEIYG